MSLPRLALAAFLALAQTLSAETALAETALAESGGDTAAPVLSIADLGQVLQFEDLFDVLRAESLARADALADQMLPGGKGVGWDRAMAKVHDLRRIRAEVNRALRVHLGKDPAAAAEIREFFASDLGQRILSLEVEARRAFLDVALMEAAQVAADTPQTARDPKWQQIQRLIEAGDLIEMNVAGGLSGSLGFALGLQGSGAVGMARPVDELAADTWGGEAQLRADTASWLKAYFGLAYAPLSEAELETYVVFMESPAGRHYSAALFVAFDATFRRVSQDLGRAIGAAMQSQDI